MPDANTEYTLIEELRAGMKNLNMVFIVIDMSAPTTTKDGRQVRTAKVGDASACVNLSVWDEPGALMQPGDIIRLTRGYAALWRGSLTLYAGKTGDLQKVGEFCMLFNESVNMSEPAGSSQQAERPESTSPFFMCYDYSENDYPAYRSHRGRPHARGGGGAARR